YMAPEQATDPATADRRADLYSLGATLFYLLTGRPPFADRATTQAKLQAHQFAPVPDIGRLRPDVPLSLRDTLARLLAKGPEDRYPTAQAVADELGQISKDFAGAVQPRETSVGATTESWPESMAAPGRRIPARRLGAVAVLAVLATVSILALRPWSR